MHKKLFIESWSSTKRYTYNLFIKNQFTAKTRNQENNGLITVAKEWMIATFERITFLQPIYSNSIEQRVFFNSNRMTHSIPSPVPSYQTLHVYRGILNFTHKKQTKRDSLYIFQQYTHNVKQIRIAHIVDK